MRAFEEMNSMADSKKTQPGDLARACFRGQDEEALRLLAAGADPEDENPDEKSLRALNCAIDAGSMALVEALLAAGAALQRPKETPPIELAARSKTDASAEIVAALIKAGADPNGDGEGFPPLFAALFFYGGTVHPALPKIVKVLLAAGADPVAAWDGEHVMKTSAFTEHPEIAAPIAQAAADRGLEIPRSRFTHPFPRVIEAIIKHAPDSLLRELVDAGSNVGCDDDKREAIWNKELARRIRKEAGEIGKAAKKPRKKKAEKPAGEPKKTDIRI